MKIEKLTIKKEHSKLFREIQSNPKCFNEFKEDLWNKCEELFSLIKEEGERVECEFHQRLNVNEYHLIGKFYLNSDKSVDFDEFKKVDINQYLDHLNYLENKYN